MSSRTPTPREPATVESPAEPQRVGWKFFWVDPDNLAYAHVGFRFDRDRAEEMRQQIIEAMSHEVKASGNFAALRALRKLWRQAIICAAVTLLSGLNALNNLLLAPLLTLIAVEWWLGGVPAMIDRDYGHLSWLFSACFATEYALGLLLAPNKPAYLRNFWTIADGVSAVPLTYVFNLLRLSRFGRLLRILKLAKLLRARRARFPFRRFLRGGGIALSTVLSSAIALEAVEPETVPTLTDAVWWSVVTISTVGYGDISPVTPTGRIIAGGVILVGVGIFSYMAGVMGNWVTDEEEDEILERVRNIERMLEASLPASVNDDPPVN